MTSPFLPDDCIYCILKYLKPYHSTLFNCLLVNRFWCKATVPLLYADPPFPCRYADPFLYANNKRSPITLILTLIMCLNKTEILQLKNQLQPIKFKKIDTINSINNIINDDHKPLFEYPKYLENYDYFKINNAILLWLDLYDGDYIPIFHQSILCQCNNIKQLNIPLYVLHDCNVQTIKTITLNLSKLNSLKISTLKETNETLAEFSNNIKNICLNLRKFEINNFYSTDKTLRENLCKIIQKQNNLEVIKLSSFCQGFLNNIFLSLEFQKHSLVDIEFRYINFGNISFKNFINLYNLKYLKFRNCNPGGIMIDKYEILKYASFKLKRLELIVNDRYGGHFTSLMIKYLGVSLQELILDEKLDIFIIKSISEYCLNLVTLEIWTDQNIDLSIFSYFKNLKIRILNIDIHRGPVDPHWEDIPEIDIDIFRNLANNLPINVMEVSFLSYHSHHLHFKEFLENCHDFLEVIGINSPIKLTLLEIILDYIERSSSNLKYLGITKLEKELDDEELKLFNQINAKGVRIVDFYSVYNKPVKF